MGRRQSESQTSKQTPETGLSSSLLITRINTKQDSSKIPRASSKPEEAPTDLETLHQYKYNDAAIRHATAMQFKMISNTMHPSLAECQSASYGYPKDDKMPPHEFGIAVGVMLNRGYKMSDILDPDKLKASKSILGKSIKEAFQSASPHLIKNRSQLFEDAANGYKNFKLQSELRHLDSKAESEEDTVRMFADKRFQPGILRLMNGFGEAFHEFQSYYPTVCSEISAEKRTNIEKNMDNVRNMCSILSPDRVKAIFDYYQSPEYLQGRVSESGNLEKKAAESTLILQEFMIQNQTLEASCQMKDIKAFERLPEIQAQIDGLKSMNAEQLSTYIQKNHPIDQFLSRSRGGSAAAVSPSPVVTAVPPPVSSDLDAESTQAKPVEEIELATLIESIHGAPEKMASKVKPVVKKPIIKKPEEAGRRK